MDFEKLTNKNLIFLDCNFETKNDVIQFLVNKLYEENKISSKEEFLKDVMERELLSETGVDKGIAIPHGKSDAVKEASFAVVKVNKYIADWESVVEDNKVTLIFLLAIPKGESGDTHIKLLAELMTKISDDNFIESLKTAKTVDEFYNALKSDENESLNESKTYTKTIVAVTACPAGIAHTYMAADALIKAGEELGVKVHVEKQGANGIEDRHTSEILKNADAAIFAVEVAVKESERFDHLPIYRTKVSAPIKDGKTIIMEALKKQKPTNTKYSDVKISEIKEDKESIGSEIKKSVLTGISYIIPLIVAGGMINAFAVLISQGFNLQELYNETGSWLWMFRKLGGNMLGTLMVPVLSAYMAYSISDKTALAPGFAAGIAANLVNGGFLCGMLGGLIAGYIVRMFKKVIPAKGTLAGFVSFWIYPVFSTLIIGVIMFFIIGEPIAWINQWLINTLGSLSGSNALLLGAIIGIMVSFDLGGPVNKAAYTFCIGAMAEGILIPYAVFASVKMVSAFAVTFATLGFKKYFNMEEKEVGMSTWVLGFAGITEGAIPFMMADPIRVIFSFCIGSAFTGAIVAIFGIGLDVPGAGIFSMFLLKGGINSLTNSLVWFFAAIVGAFISAILLVVTRKLKLKKQEA